jgi:hypothetical protein
MNRNLRLFAFVAVLALAILACGGGGDAPSQQDPSILFQDDFSTKDGEWDEVSVAGEGITNYSNEAYQIRVETANTDVWANPSGQSFTDVRVEVSAQKVTGGTDNNDFGVVCRYKDELNFYFFIISSDGYYGIGKVVEGQQELIGMDSMLPSDTINQGDATNTVRGDCIGETLTLFVNGEQVDSQSDTGIKEGNVGLMAGTFDDTPTDILFDNFVVRKP